MFALFTVEEWKFSQGLSRFEGRTGKAFHEEFKDEGRLLAAELVKRTPPFSGKALRRMLGKQGKTLNDPDMEDMSAYAIGKNRVEKDIRKVIYGVKGATMPAPKTAQVHKSQNIAAVMDFGVLQKCQGKEAIRIFANRSGGVFGIDRERFKPSAGMADLEATHKEHRTKRGRVTTAGSKDRVVGRWKWLNILVTKEAIVKKFEKLKQKMVGQAKGGWAASFVALGGRMSLNGWVGRHIGAGSCNVVLNKDESRITMINKSAWASGGDPERVRAKSLEGRARAMKARLSHMLKQEWGRKAA